MGHEIGNLLDIPLKGGKREGIKESMAHRNSEIHLGKYWKTFD